MSAAYVLLEGGGPRHIVGLKPAVAPPRSRPLQVTIYLKCPAELPHPGAEQISREEFAAKYGAPKQDVDKVVSFAGRFGLTVDQVDRPARRVILSGTPAQFAKAFRIEFVWQLDSNGNVYRSHRGNIQIPANLAGTVSSVLGLEDLPQA
jgi:kumamolisin